LNIALMMGVLSRMISSSALITAIPEASERGSFMSINSSVQQFSGGIASIIGGLIVTQSVTGALKHYDIIGYIVVTTIIFTIIIMRSLNRFVLGKSKMNEYSQPVADKELVIAE